MSETINIQTEGGEFTAYMAKPAGDLAPAIIVLHELFGVNEDIRLTCHEPPPRASSPSPRSFTGGRNVASTWIRRRNPTGGRV
jgi:hypothetical protein